MKHILNHCILFLLCLFVVTCGGTETGNPNVIIESDFSGAKAYLSNAGASLDRSNQSTLRKFREFIFGTKPTSVVMQSGASEDSSYAPLLKLTQDDKLLPAITMKYNTDLPKVLQMAKIDADYYVLFDKGILVGGSTCTLLQLSTDGKVVCIDSPENPSEARATDPKLDFHTDQRYFLVTKFADGLVYRATDGSLKIRDAAGIHRFGPDGWTFGRTFITSGGELYGLNCRFYAVPTQYEEYVSCKIAETAVEVFSQDVASVSPKVFLANAIPDPPLYQWDVIYVVTGTDASNTHLFNEQPGVMFSDYFDAANGMNPDELTFVRNMESIIQRDDFSQVPFFSFGIGRGPSGQVCVPIITNANMDLSQDCAGHPNVGGGNFPYFDALDFNGDRAIVAWSGDTSNCQIATFAFSASIDPSYELLTSCNEINSLPTMARYISYDVFVFGGPKKGSGSNPLKYYYYQYDFSTHTQKLLFESERELVIFPFTE